MYIPKTNSFTDKLEIVDFMRQFSFATIITSENNYPVASHLPFLISLEQDKIILTSHFAKVNEQWKDIEKSKVLVIFSEPHAYISPKNYDKELNVPTWNYISVHAYGQGTLITEKQKVIDLLENTIETYEMGYKKQWNSLPEDYKLKMLQGIVGFNIVVTDLQAKKKLSQNKTANEQTKIIDSLAKSSDTNEQLIAEFMKKNST